MVSPPPYTILVSFTVCCNTQRASWRERSASSRICCVAPRTTIVQASPSATPEKRSSCNRRHDQINTTFRTAAPQLRFYLTPDETCCVPPPPLPSPLPPPHPPLPSPLPLPIPFPLLLPPPAIIHMYTPPPVTYTTLISLAHSHNPPHAHPTLHTHHSSPTRNVLQVTRSVNKICARCMQQ